MHTGTKNIKAVVVGSAFSGKTCFSLQSCCQRSPEEYIPTVFDNFSVKKTVDEQPVYVGFFDTGKS